VRIFFYEIRATDSILLVLSLSIYLKIMNKSPDHKIHCFLFGYQLSHPVREVVQKLNEIIA
jgi:hypothetical protein